jgi:MFS family permease
MRLAGTRPPASSGDGNSARPPALRDDAQFLRSAAAGRVSYAGTAIMGVVLPILVYRRTGSAWQTSLLVAVEIIPYLVFGLLAGVVADPGSPSPQQVDPGRKPR